MFDPSEGLGLVSLVFSSDPCKMEKYGEGHEELAISILKKHGAILDCAGDSLGAGMRLICRVRLGESVKPLAFHQHR